MNEVRIIGLDLAKRIFQVHGIDQQGQVVIQKRLQRSEVLSWFSLLKPCLIGMEACATAHYWARELSTLGHEVKMIPPSYVKPYVRRQKNDRADAAAICEAVSRPSMRFVAVKSVDQQAIQVLHRSRELLIRQRTQLINALRAHLAEFGVIFPQGNAGVAQAINAVRETDKPDLPVFVKQVLSGLADHIERLKQEIAALDRRMTAWHKDHADSRRLATIPGIGIVTASAIIAAVGDGRQFKSAREFAAWIGLVPRQSSSGGKERLGRISKKGNTYLRQLLVIGATTQLRHRKKGMAPGGLWFEQLLIRKPARVASVALANKLARIAWAILTGCTEYRAPSPSIVVTASPA
ncbi:MAG: IS110 family transposase [Alphaproteobacteria bacterium]|nr:IS110 family transposase [Alphaproteobacteria bacterium]